MSEPTLNEVRTRLGRVNLTLPELVDAYVDGIFTLAEFEERMESQFPQALRIIRRQS